LESLICALIELKSNISIVEQQHPALSNDLSSLCDIVLAHLNRSDAGPLPQLPIMGAETLHCPPATPFVPSLPAPEDVENHVSAHESSPQQHTNRLNSIFDRLGDYLITGLDKMGDGVIFTFEKLLSLGSQKKTGSDEDSV
jgi:hypothetical protein